MSKRQKSLNGNVSASRNKKFPDITKETVAVELQNNASYNSIEKRFKYKLTQRELIVNVDILDAFVLHNEICVLMFTDDQRKRLSLHGLNNLNFKFDSKIDTSNISGKQKKGANNIKAGDIIARVINDCSTIDVDNQIEIHFKSPIGGKLLEFNERLFSLFPILDGNNHGRDYVAIIYPESEIPSIDGPRDWDALVKKIEYKSLSNNICYDYLKSKCERGDSCRFSHDFDFSKYSSGS